mmetsp:Transcript_29488/g.82365  ORF Transcript_29488/g.82365 Transcript_29488/m.82365 type:complete len:379 (+) Transcript_29488:199-1335(+)|eukprot:CAMPEP_0119121286 /NCGR_PEP_ID=MMETSP1310-20130426/1995_1 /TAXON_ID=464262 /ORGANISM="Genus nov. species nov., Strain RCC2339" /LENGTH=378 /DNA_ID=CAMNT_0007110849 /DNA_START=113 /DNA_END=1249 /DNA_ORIENTATION=-
MSDYEQKLLFTPGPLSVSKTTKEAMLYDLGSRDPQFMDVVSGIRKSMLAVAGVSEQEWVAIPMQGSGTFGIEAALQTTLPREKGRVGVLINGSYGRRVVLMAAAMGVPHVAKEFEEHEQVHPEAVSTLLQENPDLTNVSVVHCETSSGIMNDICAIGNAVKSANKDVVFMVDAMSSFGGIVFDLEKARVDVLITSANKCLEGVPGFAWVLMRRSVLEKCGGNSRSLSLDLYQQEKNLASVGQFRFTPPTHVLLAAKQAFVELEQEGGVAGRAARYKANQQLLWEKMRELGFQHLLPAEVASHIISTFRLPSHPNFSFEKFYQSLSDRRCCIYPGKITKEPCFRIGHIGNIQPSDVQYLADCMTIVLKEMDIPVPIPHH